MSFAGDTRVLAIDGYKRLDELEGQTFKGWDGGEWVEAKVEREEEEETQCVKIEFSDGETLVCNDEAGVCIDERTSRQIRYDNELKRKGKALQRSPRGILKKKVSFLKKKERLVRWTCLKEPISGDRVFPFAFEAGVLTGDGTQRKNNRNRFVDLFGQKQRLVDEGRLKYTGTFKTYWRRPVEVKNDQDETVTTHVKAEKGEKGAYSYIKVNLPLETPDKFLVPFGASKEDKIKWLSGYLTCDGSLNVKSLTSHAFQICCVEHGFLLDVKYLLTEFGIHSTMSFERQSGTKIIQGHKSNCKACYMLTISGTGVIRLRELGMEYYHTKEKEAIYKDLKNPKFENRHFVTVKSVKCVPPVPLFKIVSSSSKIIVNNILVAL